MSPETEAFFRSLGNVIHAHIRKMGVYQRRAAGIADAQAYQLKRGRTVAFTLSTVRKVAGSMNITVAQLIERAEKNSALKKNL